uniref:Immunoglobulin V-set domain-containing protein n=1 Tax=Astyanax mexicanus TaxID=7994 RepID=A0A3B1J7P8_ASTMX
MFIVNLKTEEKGTLLVVLLVLTISSIEPVNKTQLHALKDEVVTISYDYKGADYLFWYRQYPGSRPEALQYLLYRGVRQRSGYHHTADSRFESTASESSTDLTVTVKLADTALYYCALTDAHSDTKSLRSFTKTHTPSVCFEHKQIKVISNHTAYLLLHSLRNDWMLLCKR